MTTDGTVAHAPNMPVILVVDSDVLVRLAVADYLRGCGFKVFEASGAPEAMQILLSKHSCTVALIDLGSPNESEAFSVAQWIRQHRPKIKVLLSSSAARTARDANELCSNGPIVRKPYDHKVLERHLRKLLAQQS